MSRRHHVSKALLEVSIQMAVGAMVGLVLAVIVSDAVSLGEGLVMVVVLQIITSGLAIKLGLLRAAEDAAKR